MNFKMKIENHVISFFYSQKLTIKAPGSLKPAGESQDGRAVAHSLSEGATILQQAQFQIQSQSASSREPPAFRALSTLLRQSKGGYAMY